MMTPYQIHRIIENQLLNRNKFSNKEKEKSPNQSISPTDNQEYQYQMSGTINLNSEESNLNDTIYHSHEMENALLSSSMGNNCINNNISNNIEINLNYTPLRTYYIPNQQDIINNNNSNNNNDNNSYPITEENGPQPLYYNTKFSNKSFNTSHEITINGIYEFINSFHLTLECLLKQDYKSLMKILKGRQIDLTMYFNYIQNISISQIFSKLMRKSCMLFAMDYYKNTILKQNIIPFANFKIKLGISCVCENESVVSIDKITKIIKDDYLPQFCNFGTGCRNLFLGCFVVLDDCLGYHFKNGLKYDMNFEEGNKSVRLVGIFSTGMYSIIMERSKESNVMTSTNALSAYLITYFKKLLIKNYNIKIFDEFKIVFERLANNFINDINYENMKIFLDKNDNLLKSNYLPDSLLGFNNGYLIRLINSFKSIIPFDSYNIVIQDSKNYINRELEFVIILAYYTFNQILESIIPGIKNLVSGSFSGAEWNIFEPHNIKHLLNLFKIIKNKKLKIAAIFFIRVGLFLKYHWIYYREYLFTFTVDSILNEENGMSIHQRYLKLKKFKEEGLMDEIQVKSFLLEKGQFFRRWNYPNSFNLKPKRADKVSINKIMNHFYENEDEMINDFTNNANGFFSLDHDPIKDISGNNSFAKETTYIDGNRMKMLWKLVTYIRINNL
ncbi:Transcriptional activator spt7 [Pichia californica]|uniref:Transcriptional activator spt7 n=1 Tax=Pichia californica TaxID=460514 RepID=A0A9P7BHK4_9ASCO|nr:Transcriptional activator spt7 [[Candida] californica]